MKTLNVFVFLIMVLLNLYSDDLNWKNTERILDLEIFPWTQNILGKATGSGQLKGVPNPFDLWFMMIGLENSDHIKTARQILTLALQVKGSGA